MVSKSIAGDVPLPNGLDDLSMGVPKYLPTGMILQVGPRYVDAICFPENIL